MSELQSGIEVTGSGDTAYLTGTLMYVDKYTGFSGTVELQSGNYLGLKFDPTLPGSAITVHISNGDVKNPVKLDEDHQIVLRVKSNSQVVTVRLYDDGKVQGVANHVFKLNLDGLVLSPKQ